MCCSTMFCRSSTQRATPRQSECRGRNDKIPPQAFFFHREVRHVPVEHGIRIVGEAAWRSCLQLQVVHLPETVVSLLHGAFSRCQVLREVTASGCNIFGTKVFEERCSRTQIGVTQCQPPKHNCGLVCFKDARSCITSTWVSQSAVLQIRTKVCLTAASWKQASSHSSCRQILTG